MALVNIQVHYCPKVWVEQLSTQFTLFFRFRYIDIRVPSYEGRGISNHGTLDCSFNSLIRLTTIVIKHLLLIIHEAFLSHDANHRTWEISKPTHYIICLYPLLQSRLSNHKVIWRSQHLISRLRDFARSCDNDSSLMPLNELHLFILTGNPAASFYSLGPSDAIWRWRSWSTLVKVMACCPTAPNHYLNQCWLIISKVPWHSSEDIIIRRFEDTNQ